MLDLINARKILIGYEKKYLSSTGKKSLLLLFYLSYGQTKGNN